MRKALAPYVYHGHLVRLSEEGHLDDAPDDDCSQEEQYIQPQEISIFITCEYEGLHFRDGDVGEVDVKKEAEAELPHKEESGKGTPDVELQKCCPECVEEHHRTDELKSDEKGHCSANSQVGTCDQRF